MICKEHEKWAEEFFPEWVFFATRPPALTQVGEPSVLKRSQLKIQATKQFFLPVCCLFFVVRLYGTGCFGAFFPN